MRHGNPCGVSGGDLYPSSTISKSVPTTMRWLRCSPALPATRRLAHVCRNVARGFRLHSTLLQKSQVTKPVDETVLPFPKRYPVPICQPRGHAGPVAHRVPRMPPVAVNVHFNIRNAGLEH